MLIKLVRAIFVRLLVAIRVFVLRKYFHKRISEIFEICSYHDLTLWCDYGTLLGLVRNAKTLPFDADVDLAFICSSPSSIDKFISTYAQLGYKVIAIATDVADKKIYKVKLEKNFVVFDVSIFYQHYGKNDFNYFTLLETERGWFQRFIKFSGIKSCDVGGVKMILPKDPFDTLVNHYGPTFQKPCPNWRQVDSHDLGSTEFFVEIKYNNFWRF